MKKYLLVLVVLLFCFALPVKAQIVPDCSNCTNAEWGAQWNPATGNCAANPLLGCGNGCNCVMGLMAVITVKGGKATATNDFFGGAFTADGGFRIDRPGPLARNRVKVGDVAFRVNSRRPKRSQFGTPKRPIRRAEATWDDQGRLHLRLWR